MTLLIRNVVVLGREQARKDGSDVLVSNDRIVAIGNFPKKKADIVLDGQSAYLSAGFIDGNTDSDHYLTLFDDPSQEDSLRQGVTTIMGGMCGSSLAPLLYGSLESIQKWGDTNRINVNWHTMAEFLRALETRPLGVNFGTFAGHSTIRRAIIGEALRELTRNELAIFTHVLQTALAEGAFGLSTGLEYIHAKKAPYIELRTLAEVVKKSNRVYATHLRSTGSGVKESVEETIRLARETGVSTIISHFMPIVGSEREYAEALEIIESLPPEIDLHFDVFPSEYSLLPLYTFLPEWMQTGSIQVMAGTISDDWLAKRVKRDMNELDGNDFIVAQAPGNDFLVGRSLNDIVDMYEAKDNLDALLKLMQVMQLRGSILYKNIDVELTKRAIVSKRSLIASNAPNFPGREQGRRHVKSERSTAMFTKFLSMVEEEKIVPLNDAIKKITSRPAKKFGLLGRGEVKEGNIADLTCFKNGRVRFTIVNGKLAEQDDAFTSAFSGKVLRQRKNQ